MGEYIEEQLRATIQGSSIVDVLLALADILKQDGYLQEASLVAQAAEI